MPTWFEAWKKRIAWAKDHPTEQDQYCRAAALAQAEYLMRQAIQLKGVGQG